ncbi:prepilin-type N-terminal cleavage/methylation domain-containing protein [Candidatus Omnitrophota bacterium]
MKGNAIVSVKNSRHGLTLIELIMAIVIAAIILTPTSLVIIESVRNAFLPEYFTIASSLLERELERLTNLRFTDPELDEGTKSGTFPGVFSNYTYNVEVTFVTEDFLVSTLPSGTDYKRVTIAISRPGFPNVQGVSLVTNH